MHNSPRVVHWFVWGGLAGLVLAISGVFVSTLLQPTSPPLPVYGTVPDFKLTNQFSQPVTLATLRGKVWVADIIFTRCPGPCLAMTGKMKAIQEALPEGTDLLLVSLTADPAFDTPDVLQEYSARLHVNSPRWQFLTGPKQAVYDLAMHGLKLAVQENADKTSIEEQFIHSTRFVIVDRQGRLRGQPIDLEEPEAVDKVVRTAQSLLKEP